MLLHFTGPGALAGGAAPGTYIAISSAVICLGAGAFRLKPVRFNPTVPGFIAVRLSIPKPENIHYPFNDHYTRFWLFTIK
jgi:hypothetical protein